MEKALNELNVNDECYHKNRCEIKKELDNCYLADAKGAQIRAKAKYVAEGERSTKYFLSLEKKTQSCNVIRSLKSNNTVYTNDEDLLNIAAEFYDGLYKSRKVADNDIKNYLVNLDIHKKLSDKERDSIEGQICYAECKDVLKKLKSNKSPGLDGIPCEFYKVFW